MTLYVVEIEKNKLITHDGEVQIGVYHMSLKDFLEKTKVDYIETYWIPDIFSQRYKRINYQHHLKSASIGTKDDIRR
jgi:hypothetical protein